MKQCNRCNRTLPIESFYKCPRMRDGHFNQCIECRAKQIKEYRIDNLKHCSELQKASYKRNRLQKTQYQKDNRERLNEYIREWRAKNTDKATKITGEYKKRKRNIVNIHAVVERAVRKGKITRQPCIICGKEPADGHHCDYTKPLDLMWLCHKHHFAWHRVFKVES